MEEQQDTLARTRELGGEAGLRLAQERAAAISNPDTARKILQLGGLPGAPDNDPSRCTLPDLVETVHRLGLITDGQLAELRAAEAQRQAAALAIAAIMSSGNPSPYRAFSAFAAEFQDAFDTSVAESAYAVFGGVDAYDAMCDYEEAERVARPLQGAEREQFVADYMADLAERRELDGPVGYSPPVTQDDAEFRAKLDELTAAHGGTLPIPNGMAPEVWDRLTPAAKVVLIGICS